MILSKALIGALKKSSILFSACMAPYRLMRNIRASSYFSGKFLMSGLM